MQRIFLHLLFASTSILACAHGGKILVGYAPDAKSHLGSLTPFIKGLAQAGHQVHVLYVRTEDGSALPKSLGENISLIPVILPPVEGESTLHALDSVMWRETLHSHAMPLADYYMSLSFDSILLHASESVVGVLNDAEWDFVLCSELFAIHVYAFANELSRYRGVPYAVFATSNFVSADSYRAGLAQNWASRPALFSFEPLDGEDLFQPARFSQRLVNLLEHLGENLGSALLEHLHLPRQISQLSGRPPHFSLTAFIQHSALFFNDAIEFPLGLPASSVTEMFGVGAHCAQPGELKGDYKEFVEDPDSKGTIYVAFGTYVLWDYAPAEVKRALFSALEQFTDHRIVFSYKGEFPSYAQNLPPHIKLVKWAPQLDLLGHAKTRVFLTHGGLKSVKESLCSRTPMLVLPMYAEQGYNAKMVLASGIGSALNKYHLSREGIVAALQHMLTEPKYVHRVSELHDIFIDRIMPAVDEGAFHVGKQIRAIGRREGRKVGQEKVCFERKGLRMDLIRYQHLDLIVALIILCIWIARK